MAGPAFTAPVFHDGKDDGALRTIGEVVAATGIKAHVLRYWEQQFPILKPLKRSGGRRYYRTEDVAVVMAIDRLVNQQGYTLRGARKALGAFSGAALGAALESGDGASAQPHTLPASPASPAGQAAGRADPARGQQTDTGEQTDALQRSEFVPRLREIRNRLAAALEA